MTQPLTQPWLQTATGVAYDLLNPKPHMVDLWRDVPEALARIPRFTGHIAAGPYSVAQHSVLGADALFRESKNSLLAAAFLLHDAHEAYLGDIATPIGEAIGQMAGLVLAGIVWGASPTKDDAALKQAERRGRIAAKTAIGELKARADAAIWMAAGLNAEQMIALRPAVKDMDIRMLATERKHLLGPSPHPWGPEIEAAKPIRMTQKFTVWPWPLAADEFRSRLKLYIPALRHPRAA